MPKSGHPNASKYSPYLRKSDIINLEFKILKHGRGVLNSNDPSSLRFYAVCKLPIGKTRKIESETCFIRLNVVKKDGKMTIHGFPIFMREFEEVIPNDKNGQIYLLENPIRVPISKD